MVLDMHNDQNWQHAGYIAMEYCSKPDNNNIEESTGRVQRVNTVI